MEMTGYNAASARIAAAALESWQQTILQRAVEPADMRSAGRLDDCISMMVAATEQLEANCAAESASPGAPWSEADRQARESLRRTARILRGRGAGAANPFVAALCLLEFASGAPRAHGCAASCAAATVTRMLIAARTSWLLLPPPSDLTDGVIAVETARLQAGNQALLALRAQAASAATQAAAFAESRQLVKGSMQAGAGRARKLRADARTIATEGIGQPWPPWVSESSFAVAEEICEVLRAGALKAAHTLTRARPRLRGLDADSLAAAQCAAALAAILAALVAASDGSAD